MNGSEIRPAAGAGARRAAAGRRLRAAGPGAPDPDRLESEDDGAGDLGPRLKIGAVRTRRLASSGTASARCATPSCRRSPPVPNGGRPADAVQGECGAVQALPRESASDLARINGVAQDPAALRQVLAAARSDRQPLGRALLQPTTSRTLEPDTHGNRPMMTG